MKRRILLADDSVTIQKVIELTFMDEDYDVRAVSNGDEALALLPEVDPHFVIADVHMPGTNGYEVCRRAKQLRPDVPVLLLVGTFEPFDEGQARAVGADSFLKKPFDSQELLQRVQELLTAKAASAPPPAAAELELPALSLPLAQTEALPEFPAEPEWGTFELEAEPEPFPAVAEPFDREPSFALEPEPVYAVEPEPVFTLEESVPSIAIQEGVFGAPGELALEEPQDRYLPAEPAAPAQPAAANGGGRLSDEDVDRIARRVVELLGDKPVRDVAWEVIPDLAEVIIRDRLRELEAQVE
jgi:CheY-like chemotaxis protein